MTESLEEVRRQRDVYAAALHDLVNGVTLAKQTVTAHLTGMTVDWVWLLECLNGREDVSQLARHTPERLARLTRQASRRKDREKVGYAILECVSTLQILDALARHPESTGARRVPFDDNIRRALEKFEDVRELLTWILYPEEVPEPDKEQPMSDEWPTYEFNERVGSVFPGEFGTVKKTPPRDDLAPNNYVVAYDGRGDCLVHAKHMTKLQEA